MANKKKPQSTTNTTTQTAVSGNPALQLLAAATKALLNPGQFIKRSPKPKSS